MKVYSRFFKRLIDFMLSLIAFIVLLPVFLVVTLLLAIANDGKPFFLQPRPGKDGRIFRVIKYKTMNDKRDAQGSLLPDADRLTPIGSFVRKTSLDEIPQLLNVIKGEMSLIGPRPLLVEYLPLYNEIQRRRHEVRPGITGWAQVNGRNAISWEEKFRYDVWYVDNISFLLDVKIIFMTIGKVFKSEGISAEGVATMERFRGSNYAKD
ncbi:sugar transferase [Pontibacter virosus]|uniref:Lipopolysaccharide/colanic/teichoic acid biosynthesis glycosyltransferase n=1 Tax=Pontibacter virosus TaxID=1765052 RepID=A0A2U1B2Z0_9BACT|nr:sugar transferase [Pontibacter virosus]PVY43018.1 lipopolysaccharide/colanic/teichoic acid biosynthesis glycosyltransferase [Pontibacter virosus]